MPPLIFGRPAFQSLPILHDGHPEDNGAENAFHPRPNPHHGLERPFGHSLRGPASLGDDTIGESLWRRTPSSTTFSFADELGNIHENLDGRLS